MGKHFPMRHSFPIRSPPLGSAAQCRAWVGAVSGGSFPSHLVLQTSGCEQGKAVCLPNHHGAWAGWPLQVKLESGILFAPATGNGARIFTQGGPGSSSPAQST